VVGSSMISDVQPCAVGCGCRPLVAGYMRDDAERVSAGQRRRESGSLKVPEPASGSRWIRLKRPAENFPGTVADRRLVVLHRAEDPDQCEADQELRKDEKQDEANPEHGNRPNSTHFTSLVFHMVFPLSR